MTSYYNLVKRDDIRRREGGGGDRSVVRCPTIPPPQQGGDGYKRVDIISSDTHYGAASLCRGAGLEALLELIW